MFSCASSIVIAAPSLCNGDLQVSGLPNHVSAAFQLQRLQRNPWAEMNSDIDRPMITDTRFGFDVVMITVATMVTVNPYVAQEYSQYPSQGHSGHLQHPNHPIASYSQISQSFSSGMSAMTMPWVTEFQSEPAREFHGIDFDQPYGSWTYLPDFGNPFYSGPPAIFPSMYNYDLQVNLIPPQITLPVTAPVANIVSLTQPDAYSFVVADVPEPSTVFLAAAGLALLALKRRRG
ncbi:MAG: PEP-CTERM sorting domain-containing protein [Bryobacteraceae bacterium]|nr:PEP-CTERM sorting domain-containing protein [Bryobacteraceae bacterium]